MDLSILYEDEDILIINKPAGMLSQKAQPSDLSANEYIIGYLLQSRALKETDLRTFRPSVCNRLDRNTSGLLTAGIAGFIRDIEKKNRKEILSLPGSRMHYSTAAFKGLSYEG